MHNSYLTIVIRYAEVFSLEMELHDNWLPLGKLYINFICKVVDALFLFLKIS